MFDHPQDDLLVVVALSVFAREFEDAEPGTADRALEMAFELAEQHGLDPAEATLQLELESNTKS
ncbi:hypothetical protein [Natronosalvus amylolyticus]|uniref:hypothetical protein n=1 Tax=Natronosalvus amylolyticus TaxID=2961994 RepID=UPI0020C9B47F|nr:hypothetical protein [Natronosalvus amylolyticus]